MARRRYTRAEKEAAVAQAAVAASVQAAAEEAGIPESTLRYWLDSPKFAELRAKTREEAGEGWKVILHAAQERTMQLIPTMDPDQIMVLAGIATDKLQLISGQATSRSEHRDLLADFDDHERGAARQWVLDQARKRLVDAGD